MIYHEPVIELHPSIDKDFKIDTSNLLNNLQTMHYYTGNAPVYPVAPLHDVTLKLNMKRAEPIVVLPKKTENSSFFKKIKDTIFFSSTNVRASISYSSSSNLTISNLTTLQPPLKISSKLPFCRDSVYCLNQNSKDHMEKYFHLCCFNELCRNKDIEPYLIHEHHNVPKCSDDENCSKIIDPVQRAEFRHTNVPDYLIPCRYQDKCYDKSLNHRKKYFHGETFHDS
ncbi:unnamed protein product [Rotaria sp. Silwood2]|nr:unnamed protein product [Rotaria sp. Silwood2]CAF2960341.1 unnamed protein product [Rotaria sp. Silwood2]CAF3187142.1 unnamed protein product [Rotaria sp. Silwood2]CAF3347079.1 unnamed protein product [Rotaria sp. Silwood2]